MCIGFNVFFDIKKELSGDRLKLDRWNLPDFWEMFELRMEGIAMTGSLCPEGGGRSVKFETIIELVNSFFLLKSRSELSVSLVSILR